MLASEFIISEFVMFFFGLGAIAVGVAAMVFPPLASSILWQFILWAGFSSLTLFALRSRLSSVFRGKHINPHDQNMLGKNARVVEAISPEKPGRISLDGTTWKAESFDESFQPGQTVTIIAQEGLACTVTTAISPGDPGKDNQ